MTLQPGKCLFVYWIREHDSLDTRKRRGRCRGLCPKHGEPNSRHFVLLTANWGMRTFHGKRCHVWRLSCVCNVHIKEHIFKVAERQPAAVCTRRLATGAVSFCGIVFSTWQDEQLYRVHVRLCKSVPQDASAARALLQWLSPQSVEDTTFISEV
jgi:hypothetical protein